MRVIHMYEMQLNLAMDCIGVGLRWPFLLWLSHFKTKTSFGFLTKKSGVIFLYLSFEKSENELVRPKMVFLVILAKF